MLLTEQNLEYVLESVIDTLLNEGIEIDEELLDECFEEVLSEISASKLGRYVHKAVNSKVNSMEDHDREESYGNKRDAEKSLKKVQKREKGINLAMSKLTGGEPFTRTTTVGNKTSSQRAFVGSKIPRVSARNK